MRTWCEPRCWPQGWCGLLSLLRLTEGTFTHPPFPTSTEKRKDALRVCCSVQEFSKQGHMLGTQQHPPPSLSRATDSIQHPSHPAESEGSSLVPTELPPVATTGAAAISPWGQPFLSLYPSPILGSKFWLCDPKALYDRAHWAGCLWEPGGESPSHCQREGVPTGQNSHREQRLLQVRRRI